MYQSIPKLPIPFPLGQSPGIWLPLSSVRWVIWPKIRPAWWGIWLSFQNVCQRSETKGFCNSLIQHVSCILVDSMWVLLLLSFSTVISWNMPLFKAWRKDKLNKNFVVAENFVWASFADILKCLRHQEIQGMINRCIFKYIEFILFTVFLEHLRAS